ncbi:MAG: hypothetical protein J0H82_19635 [Alphaproteobacteria bacterium]|jgi:hypothetical protein|nr:hypothetical protein [Alphaproteobacteria bacterium]
MTEQADRTLQLRDHLVRLVRGNGQPVRMANADVVVMQWRQDKFSAIYQAPFQRQPGGEDTPRFLEKRPAGKAALPYVLDLWTEGRTKTKVFNLEWDGRGSFFLGALKAGKWQDELLALTVDD